ncbi:hypothetical protein J14TS2_05000 [Bacillus sp. J14TS2]|nr:hypothetical protein J14TS2_05000 [Bacillus sp. J14TS2]
MVIDDSQSDLLDKENAGLKPPSFFHNHDATTKICHHLLLSNDSVSLKKNEENR